MNHWKHFDDERLSSEADEAVHNFFLEDSLRLNEK